MSGVDNIDRQFREVNAYNLFFSSINARASPSLSGQGWYAPLKFGEVADPFTDATVRPDFVLYNGTICLLVEIKSGNNIETRHIEQMARCRELSIDGVESELDDADVAGKTPYDGSLAEIESCIVYQDMDEDWIENCRNDWDDCGDALEDLEAETAILTQDYGERLRLIAGEFSTPELQELFTGGIQLPENPKEEFVLTEGMEKEILAVAICGIWGERIVDHEEPIETSVAQIRDHFAPVHNLPPQRVSRTLNYLDAIDACSHVEDLTYAFSRNNINQILGIKQTVRENPVEEVLSEGGALPDEQQATLDMDRFGGTEEDE
jgi:hypothetical protein